MVWYTFITSRNPFAEYFADTISQCVLAGNTRKRSVGGGVNKAVDERKAVSRREILSLVVDVCVPGEKGGLKKRNRRRFESKTFVAVRCSYVSTREFGGENDDYSGERSSQRFGANMTQSGGMGHYEHNLLSGREKAIIAWFGCWRDE
jgi:hypothetical protein